MVKLYYRHFGGTLNMEEIQKFGFCLRDLYKSSSKLLNRILRYCTQIVFGYVLLKFGQMVGPPTLLVK